MQNAKTAGTYSAFDLITRRILKQLQILFLVLLYFCCLFATCRAKSIVGVGYFKT